MTAIEAAIASLLEGKPDYVRGFCDSMRVSNEQMWGLAKVKGELPTDFTPPPFGEYLTVTAPDGSSVTLNCKTGEVEKR